MLTRAALRHALLWLLPLLLVACGSPATAAQALPSRPAPTYATAGQSVDPMGPADLAPSPSEAPTAAPTAPPAPIATPPPAPIAAPPPAPPAAQPASVIVSFAGLAPGAYPVHLHRVCNGGQGYHLAYLPYLVVSGPGSGGIAVPAGDFGHGWCLVVYASRAQTAVAAYRPI